jgi:hypothetical protein
MKTPVFFPEIITPKSYPERLGALDYDPYAVVPTVFPARPYLQATTEQVRMVRARMREGAWHRQAFAHIREQAAGPAPELDIQDLQLKPLLASAGHALQNAMVAHVAGDGASRQKALRVLRTLARIYPELPIRPGCGRLPGGCDFDEAAFISQAAKTYDFLAADGLSRVDDVLFRDFLKATAAGSDAGNHRNCNNHHTGGLAGRLAAALALQDRQAIHDSLYGHNRGGAWTYGLIHQLRHEFLADGLQWERAISYHAYTLTHFVEMLDLLLNVGVDLWNAKLPPLWQNDGFDEHRDYGLHADETRSFKATFEILLYLAFPNGQLSMIGDSNFGALQGIAHACGTLFERAWQVYRDPRFAWIIRRVEAEAPSAGQSLPGIPMALWLSGCRDLFRVERKTLPRGKFDLSREVRISSAGEHRHGCSCFNAIGATLLRSRGGDLQAPAAYVFWGPHSAGHQNPCPLHLELYGGNATRVPAPRSALWNESDPLYPNWKRTTVAHNTVTVDHTPAFPYDFETGSIWEADIWRDRISDGERIWFEPDAAAFKALRVRNGRVYPGVVLDRTVVVTPHLALDVFRCHSSTVHTFDWAMHVIGTPVGLSSLSKAPPLKGRGYAQLKDLRRVPISRNALDLTWEAPEGQTRGAIRTVSPSRAFLGRDPESTFRAVGQATPAGVRHAVIVRTRGKEALFVSAWTFDGTPIAITGLTGTAQTALRFRLRAGQRRTDWTIPFDDQARIRAGIARS